MVFNFFLLICCIRLVQVYMYITQNPRTSHFQTDSTFDAWYSRYFLCYSLPIHHIQHQPNVMVEIFQVLYGKNLRRSQVSHASLVPEVYCRFYHCLDCTGPCEFPGCTHLWWLLNAFRRDNRNLLLDFPANLIKNIVSYIIKTEGN